MPKKQSYRRMHPLIPFFLMFVTYHQTASSKNSTKVDVCKSEACSVAAGRILKSMNKSVDPCEDFYSFSCGGWMQRRHLDSTVFKSIRMQILLDITKMLEEDRDSPVSVEPPEIERKIFKIYDTCLKYDKFDKDTIKWFEEILEKIGGFPMLSDEWRAKDYDWIRSFSRLSLLLHLEPLLLVASKVDNKNSSRNLLMVSQPARGESVNIPEVAAVPLFFDKARGTEHELKPGGIVLSDLLELNVFQNKLKSITKYKEDFDDEQELEVTMKVIELQDLIPSVDWLQFFDTATGGMLAITEDDDVVIYGKDYVVNLIEMIDNGTISKRTIANFLGYNALAKTMENFPVALVDLSKNYRPSNMRKRSITDVNEPEIERELTAEEGQKIVCLWSIILPLSFAIDHMVLNRRKYSHLKMNNMVENMSISLKQLLKNQHWMDENSRKFLLDKQKEMAVLYDYPNWITNIENIEKFYESLREPSDNPLENYANMVQFVRRSSFLFVTQENNRLKWPLYAALPSSSLNAFYLKNFNTILLPFVLKHPTLYHRERPSYLNYGCVGMMIGHEMGHGFDKLNVQRDKFGTLKGWPNENFKKEYLKRGKCLIEQYSNFSLNKYGVKLDGKKTLSQNIADVIGLRISHRAFKRLQRLTGPDPVLEGLEEYTPEQLFFITFGTSWCETDDGTSSYQKNDKSDHSPSKFRILGTVTNMKEFSRAFNCRSNSKMNPEKKCSIF